MPPSQSQTADYPLPMRYFTWLLDACHVHETHDSPLLADIPYSYDELSDPDQLIEWAVLCRLMSNLEGMYSEPEMVALSQTSLDAPRNRLLSLAARTLLSVREGYHWGYRAETGVVARTYAALNCATFDLDDGRLRVEVTAQQGLDFPRGLKLVMWGQISAVPELFGFTRATVDMVEIPGGVRYLIDHQDHTSWLTRARWFVMRFFTKQDTAQELNASLQQELDRLRLTMTALRESEARYELLASNFHDLIWTTDMRGRVTFVSPSVSRHFDIDPQEMLSDPLATLDGVADFRPVNRAVLREIALEHRGGRPPDRRRTVVLDANAPDGRQLTIEVAITIARDDAGTATGALCVGRDITERQRLTQRIAEKRNLESLGLLAGGVAHDFNNLLTGVMGHAELINAKLPPDSPLRADVDRIVRSAESAANLCDQMLAFSGKSSLGREATNLSSRAESLMDLLGSTLPGNALVERELDPALPDVMANPTQIDQIIMNLILNAVEALPQHGGRVTVRTHAGPISRDMIERSGWSEPVSPGMFSWLEVADTGEGVDEDIVGRIFEPFYSTKGHGRGMGLAAVSGVVRACGGFMQVQSPPSGQSRGSCFSVALPAVESSPKPTRARAPEPTSSSLAWHVLVIDDERAILEIAEEILVALGCTVTTAAGGKEGLKALANAVTPTDIVMLDLTMPDMSGRDTYLRIRASFPELPVLFMSGFNRQGMPGESGADPHAGFIHKPFRIEELVRHIDGLLQRDGANPL